RAFDLPRVGDGDHHFLVGDHVFGGDLVLTMDDLCPPVVAVPVAEFFQLILDDLHPHGLVGQDVLQARDKLLNLLVLLLDFFAFQAGKALETHIEDGLCLDFRKPEPFDKAGAGRIGVGGIANQRNDLVEVIQGYEIPFQDMGAPFGFGKFKFGASDHHVVPVVDKIFDQILEIERQRPPLHEGYVVDAEGRLKCGILVQVVQDNIADGILLQVVNDSEPFPIGFIADVGNAFDYLIIHQGGRFFDHLRLVHLVGNLGHDDLFPAAGGGHNLGPAAYHDPSPPIQGGLAYPLHPIDETTRREIRRGDVLHELGDGDVVVVDIGRNAVHHLAEVVGRHVCGHSDGNTGRAIDKQVRELAGQYGRFLERVVKVRLEVDCILVDVG